MEEKNHNGEGQGHGSGPSAARWVAIVAVTLIAFYFAGFFTRGLLLSGPAEGLGALREQVGRVEGQLNRITAQLEIGPDREAESDSQVDSRSARAKVSSDDDPVIGTADAPVTMIEFSDFQCPFCKRFFEETLPQIEDEYIKPGKVKLVYRDFPLGFHQQAQLAAEAAECADDQGQFRQMHDQIFQGQAEWSGNSEAREMFAGYAQAIGLDLEEFNRCLDSGKYGEEVQGDVNDGRQYGVKGTPTFFINGQRVVGAQPFAAFKQVIDDELDRVIKE